MVTTTQLPADGRRILVVDDNPDAARGLCDVLDAIGHVTRPSWSGASALECLDEFAPDVVLVDLSMPLMNGFEVADRIRNLPGGSAKVIVAVTGRGRPGDLAEVRKAGFDHYLVKPVSLESLRAIVGDPAESSRDIPIDDPEPAPHALRQCVTAADDACKRGDAKGLAAAVKPLIQKVANGLGIDLVAVIELARYDMELACIRWMHLRARLLPA